MIAVSTPISSLHSQQFTPRGQFPLLATTIDQLISMGRESGDGGTGVGPAFYPAGGIARLLQSVAHHFEGPSDKVSAQQAVQSLAESVRREVNSAPPVVGVHLVADHALDRKVRALSHFLVTAASSPALDPGALNVALDAFHANQK